MTASFMFAPASGNATSAASASSRDEQRRQLLLRRLNEISQQRQRLERRQQRTLAKEAASASASALNPAPASSPPPNGATSSPSLHLHPVNPRTSVDAMAGGPPQQAPIPSSQQHQQNSVSSLPAAAASRDDMSVDYVPYTTSPRRGEEQNAGGDDANGAVVVGGIAGGGASTAGNKRHSAPPKRRRGDASNPDVGLDGDEVDTSHRNGRLSSSRPRGGASSAGGNATSGRGGGGGAALSAPPLRTQHVPPIDLDAVPDRSSVSNLDVFNRGRNRGSSRIPSPQGSPTQSARGSGRVRTPSVLLSSRPGERAASSQAGPSSKHRQVAYCLRLIKEMIRLKDGYAFSRPIDQLWSVDQLPGYFELIKEPMDLGTIRKRLEAGYYMQAQGKSDVEEVMFNVEAFKLDGRLVFSNAHAYNRPGDVFYESATRLLEKFESRVGQMPSSAELAQQASKKTKKRKKGGSTAATVTAGEKSLKKSDSSKKRKVARGGNVTEENGQATKRLVSKKKPPASAGGKSRGGGGVGGGSKKKVAEKQKEKGTAKSGAEVEETKPQTQMTLENVELRLRALSRQRELLESGSPASPPAGGGASYMQQAQALYHVEMTFEEKVQLSANVGKLPPDKLQKIVTLATKNKTGSMEVNNNEEIELDIDSMNNETLREMEAYVNQILSKKKKGGAVLAPSPNADIVSMSLPQVKAEVERLTVVARKLSKSKGKEQGGAGEDGKGGGGDDGKKTKSFYDDSDSSSSDESGSGSSDDSSSDSSDSSDEESDGDTMRKRRERNLAHQQAMQAAGTPMQSPPYSQPSS